MNIKNRGINGDITKGVLQRLDEVIESKPNIIFIDLYSNFVSGEILNPNYDCGDNLHLSGPGYLEWCRLIKDYVYE